MSRKPSPKRLKARLTIRIVQPGIVTSHQWSSIKRLPVESIAPHSGVGGWAPRPRKPSPAAVSNIDDMLSVMRTITEGRQSGIRLRKITRACDHPCKRTTEM